MDLKKLASKVKAFVVSSTLALTLISCGANIDSSGWLTNLDDAKKAGERTLAFNIFRYVHLIQIQANKIICSLQP